jgi:hypothetical protein
VHLCIILVDNQLDAQFFLWYVYLYPLHVLSNYVLILRRTGVLIQLSSWGWTHSFSKHVEDLNKHIIEEIVRLVGYLQELYILPIEKKLRLWRYIAWRRQKCQWLLPRWERLSVTVNECFELLSGVCFVVALFASISTWSKIQVL